MSFPNPDPRAAAQSTDAGGAAIRAARDRALAEAMVDRAIVATDRADRITDWSPGAARMLGWSAAEAIGEQAGRLLDRADAPPEAGIPERQQALRQGRVAGEGWHLRRDGNRFWARSELLPLHGPDGAHLGFLRILRDRSEQRRAAELHRSDAEFLERVLASSGDCNKVLDLEGRLLFISQGGQVVMEITDIDAVLGRPWADFWRGDGHRAAVAALEDARAGETSRFEGTADTMAGNPRWWEVQVSPILGPDRRPEKLLVVSRDVSARRQADAEIGRLVGLVEQSSEFIGIASPGGRLLFVNPAGLRLVGLGSLAEARGRHVLDLFMPAHQATIRQQVLPTLPEQGYWEGEVEFRHLATGTAIPVLHSLFPLRDAAGATTGYGTVTRDLRELRRADARRTALLELGDGMRDLDDPAEMAFVAAGIMGRTLGVDRAGYGVMEGGEILAIDRDWTAPGIASLAGQHRLRGYGSFVEALRHGETVAVADVDHDPRTGMQAAFRAIGTRALVNLPLIEHGGLVAVFYVSHATPRPWSAEELGFVRDVAERTRAAIERRRAEHRLRDLATQLEHQVAERTRERDRIWRVSQDLLGVCDLQGRWIGINPAWQALLGWTPGDIIGRSIHWLEHPDDIAATRAEIERLRDGNRTIAYEHRVRASDGHYRRLSWTAVPEDGLLYCVARDVTAERAAAEALHEAEERLRQSQKMEAVGQLTGGMAHDFNNLLTGISGSLELVGTRIAQGRGQDAARYITAAQDAARRAAALTHRLLAFSRRQTLEAQVVDVNHLVAGMEDMIRRTTGPDVTIEVVSAPGLWAALVDANQLENALLNLCINARDAMPDGGRITIETANNWLDEAAARGCELPPGDYLSMRVTDTGAGMAPETIARAFDPFFTTKKLGEGTGLGLSMIYGFARQSGGQVRISSEVGAGTSMCLYLPRHEGAAAGTDGT